MTLYRVYYRENGKGYEYCCYIEVPDNLGRKKAQAARDEAHETHNIPYEWITRTVKDC